MLAHRKGRAKGNNVSSLIATPCRVYLLLGNLARQGVSLYCRKRQKGTQTMPYQVIGTTRNPDGDKNGRILDLIIAQNGTYSIITKDRAIELAHAKQLWATDEFGNSVWVVPVERGEYPDYVRTQSDRTRKNNLLALSIWVKAQQRWIYSPAA